MNRLLVSFYTLRNSLYDYKNPKGDLNIINNKGSCKQYEMRRIHGSTMLTPHNLYIITDWQIYWGIG